MNKFGSEVLPDDFFVEESTEPALTRVRSESELSEARDIAIANPHKWVRVGYVRELLKDPSAWCSEVNRGTKKGLQNFGGEFRARWWLSDAADPNMAINQYGKALMFIPDEA